MQIFISLCCLLCGVASGVVYDLLYVIRCFICGVNTSLYTVKDKIFLVFCDLLYALVLTAGYIFMSVLFGFENLRLYMPVCCIAGAFIYLKSFHIIVAFFTDKVYNGLNERRRRGNERRKT